MTAATVWLLGCSKQKQQQDRLDNGHTILTVGKLIDASPENLYNPYDSIGRLHNDGLFYVDSVLGLGTHSLNAVVGTLEQWVRTRIDSNFFMSISAKDSLDRFFAHAPYYVCNAIASNPMSQEAKDIVSRVIQHGIVDFNYPNSVSFSEVKNNIIDLENYYLNNNNLPAFEKRQVFGSISILRHSIYYIYKYRGVESPNPDIEIDGYGPWDMYNADVHCFNDAYRCFGFNESLTYSIAGSKQAGAGYNMYNHRICY